MVKTNHQKLDGFMKKFSTILKIGNCIFGIIITSKVFYLVYRTEKIDLRSYLIKKEVNLYEK